MKTNICVILGSLLYICILGCSPKANVLTKEEMLKIVDSNNLLLKECFEKQDIERLANMYSESAKLSPNGGNFIVGRDSIKAFWAEDFKSSKVLDMQTKTMTIDGNSDIIYETGKTTSKIEYMDSVYTPTVKFINVWVRQGDGKFHLDVDFWNKDKSN
jgi:ketosteroid isomerase-like protein